MVVYFTKAAEARARYNALAKELLVHLQRIRAGWWENDPTTATIRKIELQSRMKVLKNMYGAKW